MKEKCVYFWTRCPEGIIYDCFHKAASQAGLSLLNPLYNLINYWNDEGEKSECSDQELSLSMSDSKPFGIQTWLSDDTDIFVTFMRPGDDFLEIFDLDGLTPEEESEVIVKLITCFYLGKLDWKPIAMVVDRLGVSADIAERSLDDYLKGLATLRQRPELILFDPSLADMRLCK